MRVTLIILATIWTTSVQSEGPRYPTAEGCDPARWSEWESIIIAAEGWPGEQEDARSVRELNRRVCAHWKAGEMTQEEATRVYDAEVEAWGRRIERRRWRREGASSGAG